MTSDSGILWPRHEVLQLINPAIPQCGKSLSQGLAMEAVRQLAKMQAPDNSVSFQQWYSVAKDLLKWNENFIRLFWDMLHVAMWYRQKSDWSQQADFVQFGYLVVFLVMHITTIPKSSSPTRHSFDCVWPPAHVDAVSSPPTSPGPPQRKHLGSGTTAPLSPRQNSPRGAAGGSTSPRKAMSTPRLNTAVSFVRSHAQHLTVLRERIPLLLFALSLQDSVPAEHTEESKISSPVSHKRSAEDSSCGVTREDSPLFLATVSPSTFDTLSLLVGGGISKVQEVIMLSSLFQPEDEPDESPISSKTLSSSLRCAHLADWIDGKLRLNDALYPPCPAFGSMSPTGSNNNSGSSSPRSPGADIGVIHHPNAISEFNSPGGSPVAGSSQSSDSFSSIPALQNGQPIRREISLESRHSREPTVIHGTGSTAFHVLKVHGNGQGSSSNLDRQSSLKSLGHLDDSDSELVILDDDVNSDFNDKNGQGSSESNGLVVPERYGPVLLSACSRTNLYLLSPYTFASVSSCSDSEIVLGAVAGVVVVSGCERIQLTVACRKLILWNCRDCDIRVASLTPTIVSGDSRGLCFGPFNTSYRHLRSHLRLAHLEALIVASKSSLANVDSNCWNEIYDVNTCADLDVLTPRDRSNSEDNISVGHDLFGVHKNHNFSFHLHSYPTMTSGLSPLPNPPESVLTILNPEKYSFLPIPCSSEFQPQEMCPMVVPEAYLEAYMRKKQASASVRQGIQTSLQQIKADTNVDCQKSFDKMLTNQFLEWLVKTGKAPSLLDLVRLDAEDKNHQSDGDDVTNEFSNAALSNNSW